MLGNFSYCNPTKLYFGEDALSNLGTELRKYGKNVVIVYGAGSIKTNGIYDDVMEILKKEGKNVAEIAGVMPNPTIEKVYEGVEIAMNLSELGTTEDMIEDIVNGTFILDGGYKVLTKEEVREIVKAAM